MNYTVKNDWGTPQYKLNLDNTGLEDVRAALPEGWSITKDVREPQDSSQNILCCPFYPYCGDIHV